MLQKGEKENTQFVAQLIIIMGRFIFTKKNQTSSVAVNKLKVIWELTMFPVDKFEFACNSAVYICIPLFLLEAGNLLLNRGNDRWGLVLRRWWWSSGRRIRIVSGGGLDLVG